MRTTKKHFEYFSERVTFWVTALGLTNYEVDVEHENLKEGRLAEAQIGKFWATVRLAKNWATKPENIEEELERCAVHEVLHILLNRLFDLAQDRWLSYDTLEYENEVVVRRIEGVLTDAYNGEGD